MINLNKHTISANIKDRYGITTYAFDFENSDGNTSTELRFEITIDPNAFISRFEANIDGVLFIGQTKEKQTAAKEYDTAKTKDENAILISQPHNEIANVFQIKTNIDAKSKVSLTIQIEQYLQKTFTFNQLNIQILRDFSIYNIEPHFDHIAFQLTVEDESGIYDVVIPLTNTQDVIVDSHTINNSSKRCDITGRIGSDLNSIKCNELILKYKIKGEQNESHVLLDRNCNTFCHIISDAIAHSMAICDEEEGVNTSRIPRRVVFVLDKSGSMSGLKWTNTIRATVMGLEQLRVGCDRFGVILFDDEIEMLFDQGNGMALARDDTVSHAIDMLQKKDIGGSTDINRALLKSIEMIKSDIVSCDNELFINHIMVITDGEPNSGETNTKQIIINVKNANDLSTIDEYNDKISMFSFGVGQDGNHSQWIGDLNHSFLKLLSLNNNGFYKRIKTSFADTALAQYFDILSQPILSNITIEYKNKNVTDSTRTQFNALYVGSDLIVCGKLSNTDDAYLDVMVTGITGKRVQAKDGCVTKAIHVSSEVRVDIGAITESKSGTIGRIWAYLKLQEMAKRKLVHDDMIEKDENEEKEEEAVPLSLALQHKFVTPWTSMIVVKEKDQSKDGPLQPPDDNYAQIDFADLHHTDAVPSIAPHLIPNGHSVHNAAYGVNGYPTGPGGAPPTQLYQMTSYQSNHVPFGQIQSMQTMPAMGAHPGHTHAHHHHHNQTGSNYDELPLEFIHNIPNAPNDASQQAMSGMSGMSGYQAIEFNDTLHDDNLPDNVSSVPSNAPSSNQNNGVKLAIGSCVKVLDRGTNKWVEAEVERLDSLGHNVYVKYLNSPNTRILVSTRDIRQLLPPNHAHNSLNHDNADIQIQHVNPSGDHPPIMSLEEKAIHEFARDLWKTLHKIDVKTIPDANNDPIRGFSGKELVRHVKRHLKKHVANLNDKEIILRCSDLVQYQYIRLIASAKDKEKEKEKDEQDDAKENKIIFLDSEKFLYQFENEKHREFIKDDQPDRRAWTRGTKVEIYSSTLGGWQTGTVVEVNNDTLTITYGPPSQQMRKTLDRYQDDLVKSSATFISNRKSWNKDSEIEVYSHGQHIWCQGRIEEVLAAKENQPVDIFRVFYTNNDDKDFSKYVDRWSPDLRQVQQLSPKLAKYKKGTKVRVWSNSKQTWVPGVVIDVVPTYEVVNVRYGDHEKLVPVSSDDIKLLADNTDDHHNQ